MELLESNNLLAGWSGFELGSTPVQSKKITATRCKEVVYIHHCDRDYATFLRGVYNAAPWPETSTT